jgi:dienelactone hydrolase
MWSAALYRRFQSSQGPSGTSIFKEGAVNRVRVIAFSLLIGIACAACASAAEQPVAAPQVSALAFYDYDSSLPLNVEQTEAKHTDAFTQYHLWYTSAHSQRVSALLTIPAGAGKPPVIFVQHGYGDSKEVDYVQWPTTFLVKEGYAVMSIDAQYHGERKQPNFPQELFNVRSPEARDAFVQTVIDMRRAIDLLEKRDDVDGNRVGYLGMSMGAMLGAVFCGVDTRVDAACLVVGGGGFAQLLGAQIDPEVRTNMEIIDPVYYVGMISPRPLLMINGRKDDKVRPANAQAMFDAAREPKRIEWYDGGHYDPPLAKVQEWVSEFFANNVKK